MVETRYTDATEAANLPTLDREPKAVAFAPATSDAFRADVILLAAAPAALSPLHDAARRAGLVSEGLGSIGRPSCAVLPEAAKSGALALAFGCKRSATTRPTWRSPPPAGTSWSSACSRSCAPT